MNPGSQFAPSHCHTSSRQIQRNNPPLFKLRQCNPCGATQISTLLVQYYGFASRLEESHAVIKMGIDAGSRHLTALLLSRQLQPNNLPVCKLYQIVTMQPMWSNPNIHTSLSNAISLQKVGRQSCRWNAGNNGGSYHFTAILQAGRYNETTHRYSNCDNATHVV